MKLNQKQKIIFLDNLASLLNSGIPIIQALDIISIQTKNKRVDKILKYIENGITSGENFFKIILKMPRVFNVFDAAMIEAGEATGQIGRAFEIIVEKEEKEYDIKKKVKQALIYPIAIIIVTFVMLTVIMTYVIPKIEVIYRESNVNLPALTTYVIAVSHFFVNNIVFIIIALLVAILAFFEANKRVPKFKFWVDRHVLDIPIFGDIIKKKILVHFADFLSILLMSGITINKSLLIVKNAMANSFYAGEVDKILTKVKSGLPLSTAMGVDLYSKKDMIDKSGKKLLSTNSIAFPIEMSTAVKIGEQTGSLGKMLNKTGIRYVKEIDNIVKNLSSLLEPVIIVVIGSMVGVIIMAILMPFLNIANVVK